MTNTKKPKVNDKSNNAPHGLKDGQKMTPKQIEHEYKLGLMRECRIYGKEYSECNVYFKDKGFSLGQTQFKQLRAELKNIKSSKNWFSREALYAIEDDHKLSVERIREIDEAVYKQLKILMDKEPLSTIDVNSLVKLTAQFQSIQETKTKMFSATPLVQEMMEVHEQQQNESQITTPTKVEKEVKV